MRDLQVYLADYTGLQPFMQLATEARNLRDALSKICNGMLFRGDKVTVRKSASEPDYTVTILERFAKFRETNTQSHVPARPTEKFSLNHIEEGILEFVGRLFPKLFHDLEIMSHGIRTSSMT